MSVLVRVANRLRIPGAPTSVVAMNSGERFRFHLSVLDQEPEFRTVVTDIQRHIWDVVEKWSAGYADFPTVEIGSGVIPLGDIAENVIATDIEVAHGLDCVASAIDMPFLTGSVRAVVAQNVFHHIPDLDRALQELSRVLVPGGVAVLVEPYFGKFASLIYPSLFASEGYDLKADYRQVLLTPTGEAIPNQAVSFSYFQGGQRIEFDVAPDLSIVEHHPLRSGFRYLISGALNFRRMAPRFVFPLVGRFEEHSRIGRVFDKLAIHWIIVLKKSGD